MGGTHRDVDHALAYPEPPAHPLRHRHGAKARPLTDAQKRRIRELLELALRKPGITPDMARRLADYVDAMNCYLDSERLGGAALDPQTIADLTELFEDIDLIDLTNTVLNATRPENRPPSPRLWMTCSANIPTPEDTAP
jgi:hypothetical protein